MRPVCLILVNFRERNDPPRSLGPVMRGKIWHRLIVWKLIEMAKKDSHTDKSTRGKRFIRSTRAYRELREMELIGVATHDTSG